MGKHSGLSTCSLPEQKVHYIFSNTFSLTGSTRKRTRPKEASVRLLLFMVLSFLVQCGSGCQIASSNDPAYIYLQLSANPTTLDPALIVDVSGATIGAKLFNGLVRYDRELTIEPDLAERWQISADGTEYTFFIRHGVCFSTGRAMTAHDVKYSFERVLDPATRSPRTWVLSRIRGAHAYMSGKAREVIGIEVRDPYTLVVSLEEPFGPFLSLLSLTTASVVQREEVARWGPDFSFHASGTGPFMLRDWQHGSVLQLDANTHYFEGSPRVKGIVYRIIPEELTTMVEFETGNLDVIRIPGSGFQRYEEHPIWSRHIAGQPSLNTYYLGLNCQKPPFDDRRVRQAVGYAIDTKRILATVFEGRGIAANGPIPPLLRRSMPVLHNPYSYDPDKARELLRSAGYPEGLSIQMMITFQPEALDVIEVIQFYLNRIGIQSRIVQMEWSSFKEAVARGDTDAFWLSWWADYPDVDNFLFPLFHSANAGAGGNRTFYRNPVVDRLIDQGQQIPDENSRLRVWAEVERIVIDDCPMIFFWHKSDYFLCQPRVRTFIPHPLSTGEKGLEVELDPVSGDRVNREE